MKYLKTVLILTLSVSLLGSPFAVAKQKSELNELAHYSIINAIPLGFGADVVDIYVNGALLIDNATPGSVKSFSVPKGSYTVQFYPDGVSPISAINPLLSASTIYISKGNDFSIVAHLNDLERPVVSIFKNKLTSGGSKKSWLTVRHVAAAPAIQMRINSVNTFIPLTNSLERKKSLKVGTNYYLEAKYVSDGVLAFNPISLNLSQNQNKVIYIWGAKSKGNISFLLGETIRK